MKRTEATMQDIIDGLTEATEEEKALAEMAAEDGREADRQALERSRLRADRTPIGMDDRPMGPRLAKVYSRTIYGNGDRMPGSRICDRCGQRVGWGEDHTEWSYQVGDGLGEGGGLGGDDAHGFPSADAAANAARAKGYKVSVRL